MHTDIINEFRKKFNTTKNKAMATAERFPKDHKTRTKITECFNSVFTEYFQNIQHSHIVKNRKSAFTCKNKFCDVCNMLKGIKWRTAIDERVEYLRKTEKQRFVFLTLTIQSRPLAELHLMIDEMNEAYRRLWKSTLVYRMNGFYRVLEITFSEVNGVMMAHPHFHILIAVDNAYFKNWFSQQDLEASWQKALRVEYKPRVDIRAIKGNKQQLENSLKELVKYTIKNSDYAKLSEIQMVHLDQQLFRRRLIATAGNMKMSLKQVEKDLLQQKDDFEDTTKWLFIGKIVFSYLYKNGYIPHSIEFENKASAIILKAQTKQIIDEAKLPDKSKINRGQYINIFAKRKVAK